MTRIFLFFPLLAWIVVAPYLAKMGYSPATATYLEAAGRFWSGVTPYGSAGPGADFYKYSPFFAQLFQVFLPFSPSWGAVLWAALNSVVFFWGISRAFRFGRETPWCAWLGLLFSAMELNGALRHQQVNGLLAGLCLAALADARDGKLLRSAGLWALAANFKILPFPLAGALTLAWPRRFGLPFLASTLIFLLLPALQVGPALAWQMHLDWLQVLARDLGRTGLLDANTLLLNAGMPASAVPVRATVAAVTSGLFLWVSFSRPTPSDTRSFPWAPWASLGWCALLLLNTGTETPTFVLLAPAYLFFAFDGSSARRWTLLVTGALISLQYSDLWPRSVRLPGWETFAYKTAGVGALWIASAAWLSSTLRRKNT